MRDLLVVGIVLVGSLYALRYPWFGIMLWTWVSLMNPHALAYGFARDFPVAAIVAIATLIGVLTTKERQNPFAQSPAVWLLLFMGGSASPIRFRTMSRAAPRCSPRS
jgi:putative inorganic carbon (HCO3(-)) transporter